MSHVDDGLLHAYLDGALHADDPAEAERVERHLAACDDCRARLEVARRVRDQADALLESAVPSELDMPPFETIAARAASRAAGVGEGSPGDADDAQAMAHATRSGPVSHTQAARRPRPFAITRTLAWAASIVIALGMGWWAREQAYRPGGLLTPSEQRDQARQTTEALEAATAPTGKAMNAANALETAGEQARAPEQEKAPATQQAAGRGAQAPAARQTEVASGTRADRQAQGAAEQPTVPATQQAQTLAAQQAKAAVAETRAGKMETSVVSPPSGLATGAARSDAVAQGAPSVAADAALHAVNLGGKPSGQLTVAEAEAWLGGPVYGVAGLDVVGVVQSVAPGGARAVTVYQRLSPSNTLSLHQRRPATGDAFTLEPGGSGLIRNGTLIYTSAALPPDSVRALLRRLVPLRH